MYSKSLIHSFDEELELYKMLDLDADGEADIDVNVDKDTGDILMGWMYYNKYTTYAYC